MITEVNTQLANYNLVSDSTGTNRAGTIIESANNVAANLAQVAQQLESAAEHSSSAAQESAGAMAELSWSYLDFQKDAVRTILDSTSTGTADIDDLYETLMYHVEDMEKTVTDAVDVLSGDTIPLTGEIERAKTLGVDMMGQLAYKISVEDKRVKQGLERDWAEHSANAANVRNQADEWNSVFNDVQQSNTLMERSMYSRLDNLRYALQEEKNARKLSIEKLAKDRGTATSSLNNGLKGAVKDLERGFKTMAANAESFKADAVKGVSQDIQSFASDTDRTIRDLQGDAGYELKELEEKVGGSRALLDQVYDRLRAEAKVQKAFPRTAEKLLAQQAKSTAEEFANSRKRQRVTLKAIYDRFQIEAEAQVNKATSLVKKVAERQSQNSKGTVRSALTAMKAQAEPALKGFQDLYITVNALDAQVMAAEEMSKNADAQLQALPEQRGVTEHNAKAIIHKYDKTILERAESVADQAEKKIPEMAKVVKNAVVMGEKKLDHKVKGIERSFDQKLVASQSEMKNRIGQVNTKIDKVHNLMATATGAMEKKIAEIQQRVEGVDEKDIPAILTAVNEFVDEAQTQMYEAPAEIENAYSVTQGAVDEHLEGLRFFAGDVEKTLNSTLAPEEAKVKAAAANGLHVLNARVTEMETSSAKMKTELEGMVNTIVAANAANVESLDDSKSALQTSYVNAVSGVENEKNEFAAMQEEEQAKLNQLETTLGGDIRQASTTLESEIDAEAETADGTMSTSLSGLKSEVLEAQNGMRQAVKDATKKITDHTKDLESQNANVKGMLAEAKAKIGSTQTALSADANALGSAVDDEEKASRAADEELAQDLETMTGATEKAASVAIKQAEGHALAEMQTAERELAKSASKTTAAQEEKEKSLMEKVEAMRRKAETEMETAGSEADKLRVAANQEIAATAKLTTQLSERFDEIETIGQRQTEAFDDSVGEAKRLMKALAGEEHSEAAVLEDRMEELSAKTKTAVEAGQRDDEDMLRNLMADIQTDAGEKKQKADAVQVKIDDFSNRLKSVEDRTAEAMEESRQEADAFQVQVATRARELTKRLKEEELARKKETGELKSQSQTTGSQLNYALQTVSTLTRKVKAGIEYQYGSVDLEEQKLGRRIAEALEAAQHGDEQAVHNLRSELKAEQERTDKLLTWKQAVEKNGRRFQHVVQKEFRKLGEELDMTSIEEAEQHAMEQWAVQEQENHLKQVLGDELEKLSDAGAERLAAMAKRQGDKMAGIMANQHLTDDQRAQKLQELKDEARKQAMRVLEEDQQLTLDQATAARKLKVATKEVEKAAGVIGSLDSSVPVATDFTSVIGRVHDLINDANTHILRYPDEGGETNASVWNASYGVDTDNSTAVTTPAPSFLEEDSVAEEDGLDAQQSGVAALFQAAIAESNKAIDEDHKWKDDLHKLEMKLPPKKKT
jgi:hypothetical protein